MENKDILHIQQMAEKLLAYYERLASTDPEYSVLGISTTRWWLKLINQPTPDPVEVNQFIDVLNSHDEGSAWNEIQIFARAWRNLLHME